MRRVIVYKAFSTVTGTMSPAASLSAWLTSASKGHVILDGSLVMLEYIGFKDIALQNLFEGDVVEDTKGNRHVIEFDEQRGEWRWFPNCDSKTRRFGLSKLISNVYQDPELKIKKESQTP